MSFVRSERLPLQDARGFYRGAPDLAIEVLSPDDRPADVQEKVDDYFTGGTPMVVVVDPEERLAVVHRPGLAAATLNEDDTLDLDATVRGFAVRVSEVFD